MDKITKAKSEYRTRQWTEIIQDRQTSGKTVKAYCEEKGINAKTYYYWLRKLRTQILDQSVVALPEIGGNTEERSCEEKPNTAVKAGAVTMRCKALTIEIEDGTTKETIASVIGALLGGC